MFQFHETDLISPQQNLENTESFPSNGDQALGKTEKTVIPVKRSVFKQILSIADVSNCCLDKDQCIP